MNNQRQGSPIHMVRQNPNRFLAFDTVDASLTPKGVKATAHFLAMGRTALASQDDALPAVPPSIDDFLKEECAALVKIMAELEARQDAKAARAAKQEQQKGEAQRRRQARRAAAPEGQHGPGKQLCDFIPPAGLHEALQTCYAPRHLKVMAPDQVPGVAELVNLDALRPKCGPGFGTAGAGALAELLGLLARHALMVCPNRYRKGGRKKLRQMVLHLSAEMLAARLGKDIDTVREWTKRLEKLGYLQARPHFTRTRHNGQWTTVVDGTLYAIRLHPGHTAKLTYRDLSQTYRDLDADRQANRTAYRVVERADWLEQQATEHQAQKAIHENSVPDDTGYIRGSFPVAIKAHYLLEQLKAWAVTPGQVQDPLLSDPRISSLDELKEAVKTVQDVIYMLPAVAEAHVTKRAELVGLLGTALAHTLDDAHSQRWYCKIIWQAWTAELEGRGGLQVLATQLARLDVDRFEWGSLKRPAALLNARLRVA